MDDKQPLPELLHRVGRLIRLEDRVGRQALQPGRGGVWEGHVFPGPSPVDWRHAIDSLGTERFGAALLRGLRQLAGVDSCVAVDLEGPRTTVLFSDTTLERTCVPAIPALAPMSAHPDASVVRLDASAVGSLWRPESSACDGILVQGQRDGRAYGLAFFRMTDQEPFTDSEVDCIRSASDTWLSLLAKHKRLVQADRSDDPSHALLADDVPRLEAKLQHYLPTLSRSEMRVCARILWGMSTPGIAVDLNLQPGSVATCRKRAYRRLGIGTRLELIRMFMSACMASGR
jgi:DNA-binding CsgD family transcriptional regulator